ncbi:hypothetical protein Bca4012_037610 [Brassica carinata]|uniref:Uncharacterized protein n=1 Tax=Brassica carinata TaxID=52824 RepID=A0A8X7WFJ0_BRACI|nr:hypothetical protein Bca52824_011299 [Brassica carinata]
MVEMGEHIVREKWIYIEKAKIIREKHYQRCRHLLKKYLDYTLGVGWGKDHRPFSLHSPKPVAVEAVVKIMFCIAVSS